MQHFHIKAGAKPSFDGVPAQVIGDAIEPTSAALLGADYPDLRPAFAVQEGDEVTMGQVLFRDRTHPEIAFASPISGIVKSTIFGPRRTLSLCAVEARASTPNKLSSGPLPFRDGTSVREKLLMSGIWPAFRTRPFGRIPDPKDAPDAIFVNACQRSPQSPEPAVVLEAQLENFRLGVSMLAEMTAGKVFVSQDRGKALVEEHSGIVSASFGGSLASGLSGTHIDRLFPLRAGRQVWTIDYQDVTAMGHLSKTRQYNPNRIVSIAGPGINRPRLVQTVLGASISDLFEGEIITPPYKGGARFLERFSDQIIFGRNRPAVRRSSFLKRLFSDHRALIPNDGLEQAFALDILPVPLMRALSLGDSQMAHRLGCLALVEEDIAELSRRCTSGADYPALLRDVLNELRAKAL